MTIDEIFSELSTHMLKGIMLHDEMAQCYSFIGVKSKAKSHYKAVRHEIKNLQKLQDLYSDYYGKLINQGLVQKSQEIIPTAWFNHSKKDLSEANRQTLIKSINDSWLRWEELTKKEYQNKYLKLIEMGEISVADFLIPLIENTEKEIMDAREEQLFLKSINYSKEVEL